ncbi:FAD:protein FMN transferase [Lonepinella koalarum]|uniref:FAD:protein FMN transferase n=1 Tax=Lonepinella koalarum TaxID=53417 RepID=UPI003F6DF9C0
MVEKSVMTFIAMGTVNTITVFTPIVDEIKVAVYQLVKNLEDKFTVNRPYSEVMSINQAAGLSPVQVSSDVFDLIQQATLASLAPNSGFNAVIGSLTRLWKTSFQQHHLPTEQNVAQSLKLINPHDIVLDAKKQTVFLSKAGMQFDLGAIAKGYIADRLVQLLAQYQIYAGIIDLGGNVIAFGEASHNTQGQWKVGIQQPFAKRGQYVGIVAVKNKSIVTSGNYEKYTEIQGKSYHHIIDPNTGYPFESQLDSVTIISDRSVEGEILSTQVYFKGLEDGLKFIEKIPHFAAIFISKDQKVYVTSNLVSSFKLVSSDYELATINSVI